MQSRLKSDCFDNFTEFGIRIDKFLSQIRVIQEDWVAGAVEWVSQLLEVKKSSISEVLL